MITAYEGQSRPKGYPIGMSGDTGLSTGPHLHLGIKPEGFDFNNGYYGKINPLAYIGLIQNENGDQYTTGIVSSSTAETYLTWNLDMKAGETILIGYQYVVPNISPQFYRLGPLTIQQGEKEASESAIIEEEIQEATTSAGILKQVQDDTNGTDSGQIQTASITDEINATSSATPEVKPVLSANVYREPRSWQLAVDANGSGGMTVSPNSGNPSTTGNTYTFTFTAAETMDSGEVTLEVPSGWSAPQGSAGTAGYTVGSTTGNATIGKVLNSADDVTGWAEMGGTDACTTGNVAADTTTKYAGTGSIRCNNDESNAPDGGDGIGYVFATQNWTTLGYNQVGFWAQSVDGMTVSEIDFALVATPDCTANQLMNSNFSAGLTAGQWIYQKIALSGTLTDVEAVCFLQVSNSADSDSYYIDEVLVGPGPVTFSGSGPWTISARLLDMAATETLSLAYGSGGGTSGVRNHDTSDEYIFTAKTRINASGATVEIGSNPAITILGVADLMRHGKWFDANGVKQKFAF